MQLRTDVLNAEKREGYQTSKLTKYTDGGGGGGCRCSCSNYCCLFSKKFFNFGFKWWYSILIALLCFGRFWYPPFASFSSIFDMILFGESPVDYIVTLFLRQWQWQSFMNVIIIKFNFTAEMLKFVSVEIVCCGATRSKKSTADRKILFMLSFKNGCDSWTLLWLFINCMLLSNRCTWVWSFGGEYWIWSVERIVPLFVA